MKKSIVFLGILLFSMSMVFAQVREKPPKADINNSANFKLENYCPDPAISKINFKVLNQTGPHTGEIRVQAILKNQGGRDFISGPGQAAVLIYEQHPGAPPTLVVNREFRKLEAGTFKKIAFKRTWNSSSPAEGEFPPTYIVTISYDPDIRMDGNKQNDDCNLENNSKKRNGDWFNRELGLQ